MKSRSPAPSPGVWTLVIVLGLLVLWEVAAAGGHVNEFFFSRPSLLWQEFVDMVSSGLLARHLDVYKRKVIDNGSQALKIQIDDNIKNDMICDSFGNVGILQSRLLRLVRCV